MREFLEAHSDLKPISFHMPGHKGYDIFEKYGYKNFLEKFVDWDITEIAGADNLFHAEGIIKDVQDLYSKQYESKASYILINGSSSGIIASIRSTVPYGKTLLMARNCHRSVHSAVELAGLETAYVYPEIMDSDILGPIDSKKVEKALKEYPDTKAFILPSPNYYGICSDIESIAKVVHNAGKVLIVDQAHGAHLKYFQKFNLGEDMPKSAEECGADLVINSTHKTLASFTQTAVVNLMSDRVDRFELENNLALIQSTSPSYILMGSLSVNAQLIEEHGKEIFTNWQRNIQEFYKDAKNIEGLKVLKPSMLDITKINLDMSQLGIDGSQLEKELIERNIFPELYTGNILMLMTGVGNTKEHYRKLYHALLEISNETIDKLENNKENKINRETTHFHIPRQGEKGTISGTKEFIDLESSLNRTCARMIIPYPPGIPFICPGEKISEEIIDELLVLSEKGNEIYGLEKNKKVLVFV